MTRSMLRIAALVVSLVAAGCDSLVDFDTDLSASGEIPGTAPGQGGTLPKSWNATSSLAQTFDSKGIDADHVKSLRITAVRLSASGTEDSSHVGYIKTFEVFVKAQGLPDKRIGVIPEEKFANRPKSLEMTIDDVELKPYLATGAMTIDPKITLGSSRPFNSVPITMSMTVHVVPQL